MKITMTQFLTLDGVSQGPGSRTEDTSDGFSRGGWLVPYIDELFVQRTSEWLDLADGLLLGRRTYEAFARDWPRITDPRDPFTGRMNSLPKYVVVAPVLIGAGRQLLTHPNAATGLRLVRHEATAPGLLLLEYHATGAARTDDYHGVADLRPQPQP
ncbi:hypothetical protein CLV30_102205 [Haloactinopolyspora alba]|uniref:Dihydrofolate reductase n=1 Tax=Haloactinopolyspora alba TaxID=648780 RepID=A0A2P8EBH4_9ACTN|nr:deaminase [Haloactinopolyspora alba]PSL06816.1 hypothetical protein CLV30_102205 [Haloactinopolyspora alba]